MPFFVVISVVVLALLLPWIIRWSKDVRGDYQHWRREQRKAAEARAAEKEKEARDSEKAARGKLPTDVWWMTIVPPGSAERTGYPTQKPVRLLERIVAASSRPGDLVLDPYGGSGTTGVAAARAGRRWLLVDRNPAAVAIARTRLAAERAAGS